MEPIPMILRCPGCGARHIDEGEHATKPHHTHACQSCGDVWRPAIVATVGVQFLPGFKNDHPADVKGKCQYCGKGLPANFNACGSCADERGP